MLGWCSVELDCVSIRDIVDKLVLILRADRVRTTPPDAVNYLRNVDLSRRNLQHAKNDVASDQGPASTSSRTAMNRQRSERRINH